MCGLIYQPATAVGVSAKQHDWYRDARVPYTSLVRDSDRNLTKPPSQQPSLFLMIDAVIVNLFRLFFLDFFLPQVRKG